MANAKDAFAGLKNSAADPTIPAPHATACAIYINTGAAVASARYPITACDRPNAYQSAATGAAIRVQSGKVAVVIVFSLSQVSSSISKITAANAQRFAMPWQTA